MKKFLMLFLIVLLSFGCATAKKDVVKTNPAENVTPPAAPATPEPAGVTNPVTNPAPATAPAVPASGGEVKKLNLDVTDMSTASRNTLSEKEDPNAVKYPGISIPNVAKKEKLNNAFIRSGKGEVDTNPYSETGVKPESANKSDNEKKGYGIENTSQKVTNDKIMLKKDAITNPKDENITPSYQISNDKAKSENKSTSSDYKSVVGIKNIVKKEINDKLSVRTGRNISQENPTGTATGSKGNASKINGVTVPNPVKKSTGSFINNKIKGAGLWE